MTEQSANVSLSAWQQAVAKRDRRFSQELQGNSNPYAVVAALGLPVPRYVRFDTVDAFMARPEAGLEPLKRQCITNFYVGARSTAEGLPNIRNEKDALNEDQITSFIVDHIPPGLRGSYNLRLAEFLVGVCVVATIGRTGVINLDIARGTLPPLTSGLITPEFTATNEPTEENQTGILQYFAKPSSTAPHPQRPLPAEDESSVLNTAVRSAIWRALCMIPEYVVESDIRKPRLPGVYELAIVNHGSVQVPIFAEMTPIEKSSRGLAVLEQIPRD